MRFTNVVLPEPGPPVISDTQLCKSRFILNYFDEESTIDCGICSYCITKNKPKADLSEVSSSIIELLKETDISSREIETKLNLTPQETITALQLLLENNKIKINTNNLYSLK